MKIIKMMILEKNIDTKIMIQEIKIKRMIKKMIIKKMKTTIIIKMTIKMKLDLYNGYKKISR